MCYLGKPEKFLNSIFNLTMRQTQLTNSFPLIVPVLLTILSACSTSKITVSQTKFFYDTSVARYPGSTVSIGFMNTYSNGKIKMTKGLLHGTVSWSNYSITVEGGTFEKGKIKISDDPRFIHDDKLILKVKWNGIPITNGTYEIGLDYKGKHVVSYSGRPGRNGSDGSRGRSNYDGNGDAGYDGLPGEDGERGEVVSIYADTVTVRGVEMLKVATVGEYGRIERFIINPSGGKLNVISNGGSGGKGGDGGSGGDGGGSGRGGNGGSGNNGGKGGDAGSFKVYLLPEAEKYKYLIQMEANPGEGGRGGRKGGYGSDGPSAKRTVAGGLFHLVLDNGSKGSSGSNGAGSKGSEYFSGNVHMDW